MQAYLRWDERGGGVSCRWPGWPFIRLTFTSLAGLGAPLPGECRLFLHFLSICPSVCLLICLSIYLSIFLCVCLYVCLPAIN